MITEFITAIGLAFTGQPAVVPHPPAHGRFGEVVIPALHEREDVLIGTADPVLDRGVGHLSISAWPGQGRLVSLWAHRVTPVGGRPYGPFRNIDDLRPGDGIVLRMRYGVFMYRITGSRIIVADEWTDQRFVRAFRRHDIALAACNPPGSATERLVVFGTMTKEVE